MLENIIAFLQGSIGTISTILVCYVLWMVMKKKDEGAHERVSAAAKELAAAAAKSKGKGGKSNATKPVKNSKLPYRDNWTLEQLAEYDGKTPGKPMLLSIVSDVIASPPVLCVLMVAPPKRVCLRNEIMSRSMLDFGRSSTASLATALCLDSAAPWTCYSTCFGEDCAVV